jgi:hypothetical protein
LGHDPQLVERVVVGQPGPRQLDELLHLGAISENELQLVERLTVLVFPGVPARCRAPVDRPKELLDRVSLFQPRPDLGNPIGGEPGALLVTRPLPVAENCLDLGPEPIWLGFYFPHFQIAIERAQLLL